MSIVTTYVKRKDLLLSGKFSGFFFGMILATSGFAFQVPDHTQPFTPDSIKMPKIVKAPAQKRFGRAALELGLAEIVPFVFDRYVKKAPYAYISMQTVSTNLNPRNWAFDEDPFITNQFAHPFHGSIFYNSFRSNGYSFWQSVPAAFAGSYLWETFAENEFPAPNDFVNTGFAGIILGEVTHRLAEKIHHSHRQGFLKKGGEVLALVINPADGFNRILDRQWGTTTAGAKKGELPPVSMDFDLGMRKFSLNNTNPFAGGHFGVYGRIKLNYGSPGKDYKTPFSNFSMVTEFGHDDSSKINVVSVQGSVTGWKLDLANTTHLAILSANYDFIRNEAFFYGGESIKMNLYSEFDLPRNSKLNTYIGAGPIILSAIPDAYREFYRRNYDYGPGATFNAGGLLNIHNRISYNIRYTGSWTKTVNGNHSSYYISTFTNELNAKIANTFSISAESGYFKLRGFYRDYPNITRSYPYARLSARYVLQL